MDLHAVTTSPEALGNLGYLHSILLKPSPLGGDIRTNYASRGYLGEIDLLVNAGWETSKHPKMGFSLFWGHALALVQYFTMSLTVLCPQFIAFAKIR